MDNKFLKNEVKDTMKQNKLLDVALEKTEKQKDALREFLKRNNQLDKKESVDEELRSASNTMMIKES